MYLWYVRSSAAFLFNTFLEFSRYVNFLNFFSKLCSSFFLKARKKSVKYLYAQYYEETNSKYFISRKL